MSAQTMHHMAIFTKEKAGLLAERYFVVKALTLHFKGQQTYTSTSFAIACNYTVLL